ncbi:MAG: polyprenyl synthetase family protein [Kofleriaceae bacterium]
MVAASSLIDRVERRLGELLGSRDALTYAPVRAVTLARSKRLRARLALISARAAGVSARQAVELAATIELVHAFSLVHDDIEDGAETRRGHPAVHVSAGVPVAINAGDALHALAWTSILAVEGCTLEVARLFAITLERMVSGQARDLIWTRDQRRDIPYPDYVDMVRGKTGALLGFAAAAPAVLVGDPRADALYRFGEELGIAFQLLDDVAGRWGDADVLGKPVGASTSGPASGPGVLATAECDGTERAIECARRHVGVARGHLGDGSELLAFADTLLARLLESMA